MSKLEELQQKYKDLESEFRSKEYDLSEGKASRLAASGFAAIFTEVVQDLQSLTSSHREEIMQAYMDAQTDMGYGCSYDQADEYYEKTFGTETPPRSI